MEKVIHQHGDLLLIKIVEIPKTAKKVENLKSGYILERGEGIHTHILEDVEGVDVYEENGEIYVRVNSQARINHEEHGIQILKPGVYKKTIERVWDYETEEARKIID